MGVGLLEYDPYAVNERILLIADVLDTAGAVIYHGKYKGIALVAAAVNFIIAFCIRLNAAVDIKGPSFVKEAYLDYVDACTYKPLEYADHCFAAEVPVVNIPAIPQRAVK